MSRNRKWIIVGALVVVEVLICVATVALLAASGFTLPRARFFYVADSRAEETFEERFAADGPAALDLSNTYGDVQIGATEGDQFAIKAVKEAWGQNQREAEAKLQALEVKMTMDRGTLRIEVKDPERETTLVFGSTRASQVRFEIAAPRQTAVVVHTRHGDVTLEGTAGEAELTSRYGAIAVEDVRGSISADTNNGHVTALRCGDEAATVDLHSHYGNVTARQLTAQELTLDSNNGKLELEDATVHGDLTLNTHYGQIDMDGVNARTLKVNSQNGAIDLRDGQVDAGLDLFTHYGAVSVTGTEASDYKVETNNGSIELDGGHGLLWLHSHYGDIQVKDVRDAILDLSTTNGKVMFEGSLSLEANHKVESNYGDLTLRLPRNTAAFLDASTDYGRIRCDFDVLVQGGGDEDERRTSGDELRGTINDGAANLQVKTRNGDISIEAEPSG